jgi:hypothetical protein
MAGKAKFADRMSQYLGEAVDAACPITRPGGTTTQIGGTVGGVVGAGISSGGGKGADSDVPIGQFGWLGLGAERFTLTDASFSGKPTGDPLAQVAYADVSQIDLTDGKITTRIDLDVNDGRHIAFEVKRQGANKKVCMPVIELLRDRCTLA